MNSAQSDSHPVQLPKFALLVFLAVIVLLTLILPQPAQILPEENAGNRTFKITLTVTYENRNSEGAVWNFTEDERTLGLFVNTSVQTVYLMNVSHRIERFRYDADGNPTAVMSFSKQGLPPGECLRYEAAYRVILKPHSAPNISENDSGCLSDIPGDLKELYHRLEGPWQVDDPRVIDLAYEVAGNETRALSIVKKYIGWIKQNVIYGTSEVPKYPEETLLEGSGDCDDQANLLISLCRVVGIPAYLQIGCIYTSNRSSETSYWNSSLAINLSSIAWHGWAMVYVPPWGWLPFDLTYVADLQTDPLKAVNMSAIVAYPTVQYADIKRTDYVNTTRSLRDFVAAHEFHIYEHDVMSEEAAEERRPEATLGLWSHLFGLTQAFLLVLAVECWKSHGTSESLRNSRG